MVKRRDLLREVMSETEVSQTELSRTSGVRQPSISQFLSGRIEMSDEMLDRLISCLGYRLEVVRRPVRVELDRSHMRSWRLHRQLSSHLDREVLERGRAPESPNNDRSRHRLHSDAGGFAAGRIVASVRVIKGVGVVQAMKREQLEHPIRARVRSSTTRRSSS